MPITQFSKIQHRRGLQVDLPILDDQGQKPLSVSEIGHATDTGRLFIGSDPLQINTLSTDSDHPGNTEIVTEFTFIRNPDIFKYTFRGNTRVKANTVSTTQLTPVIRSIGEILDDYVSIKAYGAKGNGSTVASDVTNETYVLNWAINDIYSHSETPDADETAYRRIFLPAGVYVINANISVISNVVLYGEGIGRTIIKQMGTGAVINIASASNVKFSGITFEMAASNDQDIIVIDNSNNITFEDCGFKGIYVNDTSTTLAGAISFSGSSSIDDVKLFNCKIENVRNPIKFSSATSVNNVTIDSTHFDTFLTAISTDVPTTNLISSNNIFENAFGTSVINFTTNASNCSSVSDKFINCPSIPVITTTASTNVVLNNQEFVLSNVTRTKQQDAIALSLNLNAVPASAASTGFGINGSTGVDLTKYNTLFIDYTLVTSSAKRVGRLYIVSDTTYNGTVFSDLYSETAPTDIEFFPYLNGNIMDIRYTSPGDASWFTQVKASYTPLA